MGGSLARNLAHHGNKVAVFFNRSTAVPKAHERTRQRRRILPLKTLEEFVDSLVKPRTAIIMVKAGEPTDAMINALADLMEPGDIIVDAGNAYFRTPFAARRKSALADYISSDAVCPAVRKALCAGPSMMPGGSEESRKTLKPILNPSRPRPKANRVRHPYRSQWCWPLRQDGAQRY